VDWRWLSDASFPGVIPMSIFGSILNKLGFGGDAAAAPAAAASGAAVPSASAAVVGAAAVAAAPAVAPVLALSAVDVTAQLEALAAAHAGALNWKTSIVDLMKLLGLDSSLAARKALAVELACPADMLADSAQMNMWLHKAVLQKLAANGGKVPAELLD
jgi:Domain of unknown function (DUF3597)